MTIEKESPGVLSLAIEHVLPLGSENRWSDSLATLVATDPAPIARLLDLDLGGRTLKVRREAMVDRANRPDIVLSLDGQPVAVIKVKVLAGLGPRQLTRYERAQPGAGIYTLIHPGRLAVTFPSPSVWRGLTWEQVLTAHESSQHGWVRTTATAWLHHLDGAHPALGPDTVWDDLIDGEDFVIALRARMSWLFSHYTPPSHIETDLVGSSSGVSWVLRLMTPPPMHGYHIVAELEERLPNRAHPKHASTGGRRPSGLSAKVVLMQTGVQTSADFDWDYLHTLWPHMAAAREDWVTTAPRPRAAHDKAGQARIRLSEPHATSASASARPKHAEEAHACSGAVSSTPSSATLRYLLGELEQLAGLVGQLAAVPPPAASRTVNRSDGSA